MSTRFPHSKEQSMHVNTKDFYDVSSPTSNLRSIVFLGDNQKDQSFGLSGAIYLANMEQKFNEKATWFEEVEDLDESIWSIEGSWVNSWLIDDKKYWEIANEILKPHIPVTNPLPSDSRYREDLVWLWKETNIDYAQWWKETLEEWQRNDAKLRKKYSK